VKGWLKQLITRCLKLKMDERKKLQEEYNSSAETDIMVTRE